MALIRNNEARGRTQVRTFPLATGQSFSPGDFLVLNSSGLAVPGAASGSYIGAVSGVTNLILGRSVEGPTNDDGSYKPVVRVVVAEEDTEYLVPLFNSTTSLFTVADMFNKWDAYNDGGLYVVNTTQNSNNGAFIITDASEDDVPGWPTNTFTSTTNPQVWIKVSKEYQALSSARL